MAQEHTNGPEAVIVVGQFSDALGLPTAGGE
jgi:hypothetical protein